MIRWTGLAPKLQTAEQVEAYDGWENIVSCEFDECPSRAFNYPSQVAERTWKLQANSDVTFSLETSPDTLFPLLAPPEHGVRTLNPEP